MFLVMIISSGWMSDMITALLHLTAWIPNISHQIQKEYVKKLNYSFCLIEEDCNYAFIVSNKLSFQTDYSTSHWNKSKLMQQWYDVQTNHSVKYTNKMKDLIIDSLFTTVD